MPELPDVEVYRQYRGAVKSWLMDQQRIAGIGNVYSDEVLFQAGLHPRQAVAELDQATLQRLYRAMRRVLQTAIEARADPAAMLGDFLLPHRESDARCPKCGSPIQQLKAAGRTAWYCPCCQGGDCA